MCTDTRPRPPPLRVRFHIIRNARIENVGKSQSCMVSKSRMLWKQTVRLAATANSADDSGAATNAAAADAGAGGGASEWDEWGGLVDGGFGEMRVCPPDKWECSVAQGGCSYFNPKVRGHES